MRLGKKSVEQFLSGMKEIDYVKIEKWKKVKTMQEANEESKNSDLIGEMRGPQDKYKCY